MLNPSEKAYVFALQALRQKEYERAATHFEKASPHFKENHEFSLLWETTRLLLAVKEELKPDENENIEIEEVYTYGKEDELRR